MSEEEIRQENLINQMRNIDAQEFEELVADLWNFQGYNTTVTQSSSDRGIDVTATREFPFKEKILIQAKRYNSTLSGPELREYVALTKRDDVDTVIIVSTSGFTSQAKQEADEYGIKLINGESLAELLIREDAVDLVREYVGEIESADIGQKRSPERSSSSEQNIQTTTGEGEFLTIEVAGYGHESVKFGNKHDYETKKITIICLYIQNKSTADWEFTGRRELSISSEEGFSYQSPKECYNPYYEDKLSPWNNGRKFTIRRDSKARVALFYDSEFIPETIEYETQLMHAHGDVSATGDERSNDREKVTVFISDSVRSEINSIPDSLPVKSVYLH